MREVPNCRPVGAGALRTVLVVSQQRFVEFGEPYYEGKEGDDGLCYLSARQREEQIYC